MRPFKTLYGIKVPTTKYEELKQVADVLARQTFTNVSISKARRFAVLLALETFTGMLEWSRNQQYKSMRELLKPIKGTEGQDRKSYSDTQDRDSYVPDKFVKMTKGKTGGKRK